MEEELDCHLGLVDLAVPDDEEPDRVVEEGPDKPTNWLLHLDRPQRDLIPCEERSGDDAERGEDDETKGGRPTPPVGVNRSSHATDHRINEPDTGDSEERVRRPGVRIVHDLRHQRGVSGKQAIRRQRFVPKGQPRPRDQEDRREADEDLRSDPGHAPWAHP